MMNEFMDAHGLLLELKDERTKLCDEQISHVGIGFAADKSVVKVVELISKRACQVFQVTHNESGGVRVDGHMIAPPPGTERQGLYGARIVTETARLAGDLKKHITFAGTPQMTMEKTLEFTINFPAPEMDIPLFHAAQHGAEQNYLELYVRASGRADNIRYGPGTPEDRFAFKDLKLVYRMALDIFPDPRIQIEDAKDGEDQIRRKNEQDAMREQERIQKEAAKVAAIAAKQEALEKLKAGNEDRDDDDDMDGSEGAEGSHSDSGASGSGSKGKTSGMKGSSAGQSGEGEDDSDLENSDEDEEESEVQDDLHELPDEQEVRDELIRAIMDEDAEFRTLQKAN